MRRDGGRQGVVEHKDETCRSVVEHEARISEIVIVKGRARIEIDCRSDAEHDDGAHRRVAECLRDEVFEVVIVEVRARGEKRRDRARRSVVQHQDGDRRSFLELEARNPNMVLVEGQARSSEMARVHVRA